MALRKCDSECHSDICALCDDMCFVHSYGHGGMLMAYMIWELWESWNMGCAKKVVIIRALPQFMQIIEDGEGRWEETPQYRTAVEATIFGRVSKRNGPSISTEPYIQRSGPSAEPSALQSSIRSDSGQTAQQVLHDQQRDSSRSRSRSRPYPRNVWYSRALPRDLELATWHGMQACACGSASGYALPTCNMRDVLIDIRERVDPCRGTNGHQRWRKLGERPEIDKDVSTRSKRWSSSTPRWCGCWTTRLSSQTSSLRHQQQWAKHGPLRPAGRHSSSTASNQIQMMQDVAKTIIAMERHVRMCWRSIEPTRYISWAFCVLRCALDHLWWGYDILFPTEVQICIAQQSSIF